MFVLVGSTESLGRVTRKTRLERAGAFVENAHLPRRKAHVLDLLIAHLDLDLHLLQNVGSAHSLRLLARGDVAGSCWNLWRTVWHVCHGQDRYGLFTL